MRRDALSVSPGGAFCFLEGDRTPKETAGGTLLGRIQNLFKSNGRLYYFLLSVFGPVILTPVFRGHLREQLARHGEESVILNLGSGPQILQNRNDIINVDIFAFENVDIISYADNLPIDDNSVDLIINIALMEHVPEPGKVVNEMRRVLRPGGTLLCYLPFIVPFHAAPNDFHRWTIPGLRVLFRKFGRVDIGVGVGPTSGMLYVLQEWLAMLLSFGSKALHDLLFLLFMILTSPLKLLDLVLTRHPNAEKIASGFFVIAEKSDSKGEATETSGG